MKNFPAVSKFAGKHFQKGISDSHSLLEFSDFWVGFRASKRCRSRVIKASFCQGPLNGGVSNGGLPDLDLSFLFCPLLSFIVLFGTFPIFLGFSRSARGWSGDFPDLSFSSFSAYQKQLRGTVPKGFATQSRPFPKRVGNPPVCKPPGLASLNFGLFLTLLDSLDPLAGRLW